MTYVHLYKVPLPIVQKQVGHRSLKTTSVYLNPSEELVAETYSEARQDAGPAQRAPQRLIRRRVVIRE